jgi:hypothetical protein
LIEEEQRRLSNLTNNERNLLREMEEKRHSGLLGNILREQIKQSEARKARNKKEMRELN